LKKQARVVSRVDPSSDHRGATARGNCTPIAVAEGFTWSPRRHDAVEITNPAFKNAHGHRSAYQLVPLVTGGGLTQHFEAFTRNDFWVTPYNPAQFAAKNLPAYIAGSPSVANKDVVVWYKGSLHHHPRDEDGAFGPNNIWVGTAHTMQTGFMLMPHDVFELRPPRRSVSTFHRRSSPLPTR
jgi:Cu2+-containing amine oxidase